MGTQFPPWTEGTDVWGVQHLLHPELQEGIFSEWYGSPLLLEAVQQLLQAKHDELQLGKQKKEGERERECLNQTNKTYRIVQFVDQPSRF